MGNLGRRVVTALILAACFLAGLFLLPPAAFSLVMGLVVVLGAWEWAQLIRPGLVVTGTWLVLLVVAGALALAYGLLDALVLAGAAFWLFAIGAVLLFPRGAGFWRRPLVHLLAGTAVLLPAWAALTWLQRLPEGAWLIIWTLVIVVATDVGGYFAGRRFGRYKMAPRVSPGKTLEGLAGGVVLAGLVSLGVYLAGGRDFMPASAALLFTIVLVIASVFGDLFESLVKRVAQVKDSGTLLPGHGGLLDRFDAATAALPVAATLVLWLAGS